jgi:hypothetical protein
MDERKETEMDIAIGTRGIGGRGRARTVAMAVQAVLIVIAAVLLIALAASSRPYVGDPGAQGPPSTVQVAPHPLPAPLGS